MGTFRYQIALGNPSGTEFEVLNALVDTGAMYSIVPSSLLERLGVESMDRMTSMPSDANRKRNNIGQTYIRANERQVMTIVIFGDEDTAPTIGSYALTGLSLEADTANERLVEIESLPLPTLILAE